MMHSPVSGSAPQEIEAQYAGDKTTLSTDVRLAEVIRVWAKIGLLSFGGLFHDLGHSLAAFLVHINMHPKRIQVPLEDSRHDGHLRPPDARH